ncbi:type II toxin-antitoxin system antitoxin SocA domain-containing protein [Nocardia sp. NPDC050697]|uniref:Panacea domain-containing protein n=1 Tax=Nocardia sp. NPDC050697 TaxID=3155158 RepID=UPI003404B2EF
MAHVVDVARYILSKRSPMSAMKLQKLVYYSQGWHLVFDGEPLFDAPIQAWANGPVVPVLYAQHRGQFVVDEDTFAPVGQLAESELQTVDAVLASYGHLDAHQLSNLTHTERPWIEAREGVPDGARSNAEISLATMLEYYQGVFDAAQYG